MVAFAIHRAAARRFVPWKNGGGTTAEVLCVPQGADLDGFSWRISTARVAGSGPFSLFPGVSRHLAVVEGGRLTLHLPERTVELDPEAAPVRFSGEVPCTCDHAGAPVLDLNLMTRAPFHGSIRRKPPAQPETDEADEAGSLVARFLFATTDYPHADARMHDLIEVSTLSANEVAMLARTTDFVVEIRRD